ncbi:MAG: aminotransferase class I/II-fold pyridoxal phosphate-dependent enzyme [Candidatus Eisenbacteria bacterium]
MKPSATLAVNETSDRLRREGRKVFKLGLGQSPFPVPRSVVEELRANAHQKDYLPGKGLHRLRRAVADYYERTQGLTRGWEDVLVGPGSKELMFLLQLVYYGDLLIPTPSWVSYAPQARILGRHVHWLPTWREDDWRLMPEQLEKCCSGDPVRPRIVVLNYPSNPTGATYRAERLRELARIARAHKTILLSDEIYGELHHRGQHVSVARFYPEGTIVSGGLSKWCGAGGWRLGVFSFPRNLGWLLDAMAAVASETYTSTSAPIQYAAVRAFDGGLDIERYLWRARKILGTLGRWGAERLRGAGIEVGRPRGGFYLFADFSAREEVLRGRGIHSSAQLCERLLEETGVAILPGIDFGRPEEELTARIAYVDFDGARALAAVEQMPRDAVLDEEFLSAYAGNVTEAVGRIAAWVGEGESAER